MKDFIKAKEDDNWIATLKLEHDFSSHFSKYNRRDFMRMFVTISHKISNDSSFLKINSLLKAEQIVASKKLFVF
jgi:hypothetical protein